MGLEDLKKQAEEGFERVVDAAKEKAEEAKDKLAAVSYTHLTLPTKA